MKPVILVIQFRQEDNARAEREPLARVLEGRCVLTFKNALANEVNWADPLDELSGFNGVILSGSAVLYFDGGYDEAHEGRAKASELAEEAKPFARYLIDNNFPTLGICFGHQLLGYAAGATVGYSDVESKTGTHEIELTQEGEEDPLMRGVPHAFKAHYGHKDVLLGLPAGASVLANAGERCRYSAVKYNDRVYGMQFHPEYTREEIQSMVSKHPEYVPEDSDATDLFEDCEEAEQVLRNFAKLAESTQLPTIS